MAVRNSFANMFLSLGVITLACGGLLGWVSDLTKEPIAAAASAKNDMAIAAVSPAFASLLPVVAPDGTPAYIALGPAGDTVAFVVNAASSGFGGQLRMMVGFRPDGSIYDTAVLSHSETPGLGAKCTEASFTGQFKGFDPAVGKLSVRKDGGDVDAITASTITSRAYCAALASAVKNMEGLKNE